MKQKILDVMLSHGMLIHPSAAEHILSQKDPMGYAESLIKKVKEPPTILTLENLRELENSSESASVTIGQVCSAAPNAVSDVVVSSETFKPRVEPRAEPRIEPERTPAITPETAEPPTPPRPASIAPPELPTAPAPVTAAVKTKKPLAKEYDFNLTILKDITGNSTINGTVRGFTEYFRDRFRVLGQILRNKRELANAIDIRAAKRSTGQVKMVGMVSEVRITKNGNKMLILEDEADSARVIISRENRLFGDTIVVDEVIGIQGNVGKSGLIIADSIVRPDISGMRVPNRAKIDLSVAFISDIHVGSKTFLPEQWDRFIKWLNRCEDGAEKIKYIVLAGDVVDGVGVYPGQEAELLIADIHEQYLDFAQRLSGVPDYIKVVILPGNHDAVRPAEPQPAFSDNVKKTLSTANIQFAGNPCTFSIEGVNILAYHGKSMDDFISHFPGFTYSSPLPAMKEMLKRRHIAPIYGDKTPIAPENIDYLVIDRIPDIFVTGHVHSVATEVYRGIALINASTWQSQTSYQVMHNFNPIPAKVPIVNLMTGEWEIKNFMS